VSCLNVANFINLTTDSGKDYEYLWQMNDSTFSESFSASYNYDDPGEYIVRLTAVNSLGCAYSTTELLELPEGLQLTEFWFPNVITPNGDDANSEFLLMPEANECLKYQVTIFNRWGMQVYKFSESGTPFTGRNQTGELLEEGIYFYLMESEQVDCSNIIYNELCKGSVHVLR